MVSSPPASSKTVVDLYDEIPYPNVPISSTLESLDFNELYKVSYTTAQYARTRQIVDSEGTVLLNAGCGSGWETHVLAMANPGCKVVGVDLSQESVRVAEQRLRYHGYFDAEFYALDMLNLEQLGMQFDLISCNDVIYLLDNPVDGLKAMRSVLKPEGIIRTNLHNVYTRRNMLEMQEAFRLLGQNDIARPQAAANVRTLMGSLKPENDRLRHWNSRFTSGDITNIFNNFLLTGDKGFSITETFAFLRESGLDMVCLVDFGSWDIASLFKEMPDFVRERVEQLSLVEQLHLYELLNPLSHRLIDFWAEHAGSSISFPWSEQDWFTGIVHLNPVVMNSLPFRQQVSKVRQKKDGSLTAGWVAAKERRLTFSSSILSWFSLLLEGPQPFSALVEKRMEDEDHPNRDKATEEILPYLEALEEYLFVMLEPTET